MVYNGAFELPPNITIYDTELDNREAAINYVLAPLSFRCFHIQCIKLSTRPVHQR